MSFRQVCVAFAGAALAVGFCVQGQASLVYMLADHPDGEQNPPPYGLRLDNFEGAGTGVYSWQFGRPGDDVYDDALPWQQAVLELSDDGTVRIYGNMFGGKTAGSIYDSTKSGLVYIDFTYHSSFVEVDDDRIEVDDDATSVLPGSNGGTLDGLGGWFSSSTRAFFDKAINAGGESFIFDNDGHRLNPIYGLDLETTYVGRGWHMFTDGTSGTRDFLFIATAITQEVPEPSTILIWTVFGLSCTGFGFRRRVIC